MTKLILMISALVVVWTGQTVAQERTSLRKSEPIRIESVKDNATNSDCIVSRPGYKFDTERLRIGRECSCNEATAVPDENCPAKLVDVTTKKVCYQVTSRPTNNDSQRCKATAWLEYYEIRSRVQLRKPE